MITKADFEAIKQEVFDALKECFIRAIKNQVRPGEMMVFLARGDYNHSVAQGYNPNTIDTREDFYKEADRQHFLINLMDRRYSFKNSPITDDDSEMMLVELMTYTHIWESIPFLKMLRRLACMYLQLDIHKNNPTLIYGGACAKAGEIPLQGNCEGFDSTLFQEPLHDLTTKYCNFT